MACRKFCQPASVSCTPRCSGRCCLDTSQLARAWVATRRRSVGVRDWRSAPARSAGRTRVMSTWRRGGLLAWRGTPTCLVLRAHDRQLTAAPSAQCLWTCSSTCRVPLLGAGGAGACPSNLALAVLGREQRASTFACSESAFKAAAAADGWERSCIVRVPAVASGLNKATGVRAAILVLRSSCTGGSTGQCQCSTSTVLV